MFRNLPIESVHWNNTEIPNTIILIHHIITNCLFNLILPRQHWLLKIIHFYKVSKKNLSLVFEFAMFESRSHLVRVPVSVPKATVRSGPSQEVGSSIKRACAIFFAETCMQPYFLFTISVVFLVWIYRMRLWYFVRDKSNFFLRRWEGICFIFSCSFRVVFVTLEI